MTKIIKISFGFFLSILTFAFFESYYKEINIERIHNVVENVLFSLVLIALSFFVKSLKLRSYYLKFSLIIFNLSLFLETFYYYHFTSLFSESSLFVIVETNSAESKEFLLAYVNKPIFILICLTLVSTVFGLIFIGREIKILLLSKKQRILMFLSILSILVFLKVTALIVFNVPYLLVRMPISYFQEMQKFKTYGKENPIGNFTEVKRSEKDEKKEVYIVLIGESTSRLHFNLNNQYYRETTPLLNSMRDELLILNNVISPHAYTIGSLTKGLTLGNTENPNGKYQGSIIQLLNQAKFKTYWISNQRPVGISDTHVTKLARGVDKSVFLNIKHTSQQTPYDEVLLNELNSVLLEEGNKKVIFLHMIGAHFFYKMRYPREFNVFKGIPNTNFKRPEVYNIINAYDNVMRYTDSLLSEVIKTAKKQQGDSFVLYFSDHGQEVYDEIDFFGQTIDQMVTKSMYDIPMFLWMNESYKSINNVAYNTDKKYMTDDMFHSIADLCGVSSNEVQTSRSIFSYDFYERKRIIKDSLDYDIYFEK